MKVARLNTTSIQTTRNGIIDNYYLVDDNYDFNGNSATDVTDVNSLSIFFNIKRLNYGDYRTSLKSYVDIIGFQNLSLEDKKIVAQHFIVSKSDRDSVFNNQELLNHAVLYQHYTNNNLITNRFEDAAQTLVDSVDDINDYNDIHTVFINTATTETSIDWNRSMFNYILTADTIFTFLNKKEGKTIEVFIKQNLVGGWDVVFSGDTIMWQNNTPPTQTQTSGKTDFYTFKQINNTTYGFYNQNF